MSPLLHDSRARIGAVVIRKKISSIKIQELECNRLFPIEKPTKSIVHSALPRYRVAILCLLPLLMLQACAAQVQPEPEQTFSKARHIALLDVSRMPIDAWRHLKIRGRTDYKIVVMDDHLALRAQGAGGASGLIRRTAFSASECKSISWSWQVNALQKTADLAQKKTDDVAAAIFIMFGDPGLLSAPDPVPTLRYVWTTGRHHIGDVIANPYMPEKVRNIVVRAGQAELAHWMAEKRDLQADYKLAFGTEIPDDVSAIALFVDNDQTKEPVEAYFRDIEVECN